MPGRDANLCGGSPRRAVRRLMLHDSDVAAQLSQGTYDTASAAWQSCAGLEEPMAVSP
jgi:hypothetical protein